MALEFATAAPEYTIVFAGTGDVVMPTVVLGMRGAENLYLTQQGGWQAKYIPAFIRRYPFVFSSRDEGKKFTLCIDEKFAGFNQEGRGERLFDDDRKPTPYVENVLKFLQQFQIEFKRTQDFCNKLKQLNLLEPMRAQISFDSGERMFLTGFSAVERARLKTLSAVALADLAQADQLELIYLHLFSMRNFAGMRERVVGTKGADTPPAVSQSAAGATKGNGEERAIADAAEKTAKETKPAKGSAGSARDR